MIHAVIQFSDDRVSIHTATTEYVGTTFEKGFYKAHFDNRGNLIINKDDLTEVHNPFQSKETSSILKTVKAFFSSGVREKVNKLGFTHKLGILLYGIAGTGKTSLLNFVAKTMIEKRDAVVFFCNTEDDLSGAIYLAKEIRKIQDNPILFIADEFERYAEHGESAMKNLLDGNDSVENSLFLAATNYIDKVPKTLKERPSRFRIVQEIFGITDKNVMKDILVGISDKIQPSLFTDKEIDGLLADKDSVTLDVLKHMALDKATNSYIKKSSKGSLGFSNNKNDKDSEDEDDTLDIGVWLSWDNSGKLQEVKPVRTGKVSKDKKTDSNI